MTATQTSYAVALFLFGRIALAINSVTVAQPRSKAALADQRLVQPKPADFYKVVLTVGNLNDASTGQIVLQVHPDWAPLAADRFKELVNAKFYDNSRFFRVISGFMAQFGIAGDAAENTKWSSKVIKDDEDKKVPNSRGRVTFASAGKNTRSTQIFINTEENLYLNNQGYTPFAEVVSGMDIVDKLFAGYGEGAPLGKGPSQNTIEREGNSYLDASFPHLSTLQNARIMAPPTLWARYRGVAFDSLAIALLLAIGTATAYRTGALGKLHAKWKARMSSSTA